MRKILVAVLLMVLVNIGMGVVASATEDPRPWRVGPTITVTEDGK